MNRTLFIIIGVVLVFILLAVWVFMLFFGGSTENGDGAFADFGFGDTTETGVIAEPAPEDQEEVTVDVASDERLRQLTTEPVVGFMEVQENASSSLEVYYVAAGTGHLFSIDTETGEEVRVSGTTFPNTEAGAITPSGQYFMVQQGAGTGALHTVGTVDEETGEVSTTELEFGISDFASTLENRFIYAAQTIDGVSIKQYNPASGESSVITTVPFREITIQWGQSVDGPHFIYPKAASQLEGYLYRIDGRTLSRASVDGFGLTAISSADHSIYSEIENGEYTTKYYNNATKESVKTSFPFIPEKCAASTVESILFVCAETTQDYSFNMPDQWYMGELNNADRIWDVYADRQFSTSLINTLSETGREIDISEPALGAGDVNLYFINKYDQTLWLFNRTIE